MLQKMEDDWMNRQSGSGSFFTVQLLLGRKVRTLAANPGCACDQMSDFAPDEAVCEKWTGVLFFRRQETIQLLRLERSRTPINLSLLASSSR